MPLSNETLSALDDALGAVIDEAGDDPKYADLVDSLTAAKEATQGIEEGADDPTGKADEADDPSSFDFAERELKKRRDARKKPPADGGDNAGDQKGNPFA